MKIGIETKYSIGDEVWTYKNANWQPRKHKIIGVHWEYAEWHEENYNPNVEYDISNAWDCFDEDDLYATEEECERAYNEWKQRRAQEEALKRIRAQKKPEPKTTTKKIDKEIEKIKKEIER